MEKINLTKEELDNLIKKNHLNKTNNGYYMNTGCFGSVIPYKGDLGLKIHIELAKNNQFSEESFEKYVESREMISDRQIEYLASKQPNIKLSSLPKGVAYYKGKPVAVVLKYFNDHKDLLSLYMEEGKTVLDVLEGVLNSTKELIENDIYQMDIKEANFLFSKQNHKVEAVDLDGPLIVISYQNILYEERIYKNILKMSEFLIKRKLELLHKCKYLDSEEYFKRQEIINALRTEVYFYESLQLYLGEIRNKKILEKSKKLY